MWWLGIDMRLWVDRVGQSVEARVLQELGRREEVGLGACEC